MELLIIIGYIVIGIFATARAIKWMISIKKPEDKMDLFMLGLLFLLIFSIWPILILIPICIFIGRILDKIFC